MRPNRPSPPGDGIRAAGVVRRAGVLLAVVSLSALVALTVPGVARAGNAWALQTSGTASNLTDVVCLSATQCWAVGAGGVIRVTSNGGTSWAAQTSGTASALNGVACVSATQCWAVGASGVILVTSNGGTSWAAQTSGTTNALAGLSCVSTTQCWAAGASGTIVATSNGGTSWAAQASGTTAAFASIDIVNADYGWAVAAGGVIDSYKPSCSGGSLGLTAPPSATFPGVTLDGTDQNVTSSLVVVPDDERGSGVGWNITATSTTFTSSGRTLPTTATTITGATTSAATGMCVGPTNAVAYPVTLPAAAVAPTAVKAFNAAATTGTGAVNVTLALRLTAPANAYVGTYTSTWTIGIVSGP
jgi:hypothetical protein